MLFVAKSYTLLKKLNLIDHFEWVKIFRRMILCVTVGYKRAEYSFISNDSFYKLTSLFLDDEMIQYFSTQLVTVSTTRPGVSWAQECLSLNKSITTLVIFHYCSSQWRILTLLVLLLSGLWDTTGNLPPQFIVIYPKNAVIIKLKKIEEKCPNLLICVIF